MAAPPSPWLKGVNPEYSAFVIEVHVCRDIRGNVHSARRLQGVIDEQVVQTLGANGGMAEGAFGLLIEAARQEAMFQALLKYSNDEGFRDMLTSSQEVSDPVFAQMVDDTLKLMWATLSKVGPSIVRETLKQLQEGLDS